MNEDFAKFRERLIDRIVELQDALEPFTRVVIGEHRDDDENVYHSLKAHHFRDARRAFKGEKT
jgi:hypothetical protein